MPSVFFSYSHADEALRDQLEKQLAMLKRQGVIETWHDRRIGAGENIHTSIDDHINTDDIILLLVSSDFLASDYCYDIEMQRAMERHETGEAIVIPVILRACDWHSAPFGKLNAVPRDGKPITQWTDIDDAMLQVAKAVREASSRKPGKAEPAISRPSQVSAAPTPSQPTGPRSSNLRLAKAFTQRDKDQFKLDTFEYIARFFENSLAELGERNRGFEGVFRRIDANRFFATIYRDGKDVARGTVYIGGNTWGRGICYVEGETTASNSMNESLSVEADDQALFLQSMGMATFGGQRDQKLSQEGAAELLWSILVKRLQAPSH
ncbi:toll/interleukin-1 receptor domain-containing protein [Agrobacterium tumefaciens]|uniref:toll/interleukin-1 receptor domain-containing protein n=1 Tax=Agrobacterium tumefaciens TaxID=358 RepID=UPI001573D17A|nr:toll/interleukin-1 receptor domain-containing protein [Agrobacterium tumefaciens]NTD12097.1 toll/interleukin-1 receptor domain-containing protein [Agrobacterium tumefaciens]